MLGRMLKHKALSPLTMGVTLGLTGATVGMFKGAIGGYERLKVGDNSLLLAMPMWHLVQQCFEVSCVCAIAMCMRPGIRQQRLASCSPRVPAVPRCASCCYRDFARE